MTNFKIFGSLALTALLGIGMSSCSSDLNEPTLNESNPNMLVKAPKAIAYSGDHIWSQGTRGISTRGGDLAITWEACSTTLIDRDHEKEIIDAWLPEKNGNLKEGISTDFLFYADEDTSLEFYPVFSQTSTPNSLGVFYYDADGEMHEVIVWDNMNPWGLTETEWKWSEEKGSYPVVTSKGIQINIPAGVRFGFFWSGNTRTGSTTYYSVSDMNVETECTDGGGNPLHDGSTSKIHAVTFQLEGKTYLGLEDWTDYDFQDWVFTCAQELKTTTPDDILPGGDTKDEEVTPKPEDPQPEQPEEPEIGDIVKKGLGDEVEVNLTAEERNDGSLDSHLSIHVRTATDVDVFIPVPNQYYCDTDDMDIVMKHEPNHMGHGGPYEFTYVLKDSELYVTLYCEFQEGGIHIWTDGITQEVIDWCYEKCQDGITFEIWNYYNETVTLETLKDYLNQSVIKFLDKLPDTYINAFTDNENDCTVDIVDEQNSEFDAHYEGAHLNGFDNNQIYENKNAKKGNEAVE